MIKHRNSWNVGWVLAGALLLAPLGCEGPAGPAGAAGTTCTATDNGDGTYTIDCGGDVVTLSDGTDGKEGQAGQDGQTCTAVDNGDGTYDVTCGGDTFTLKDGKDVDPTTLADLQKKLDEAANVQLESCSICHSKQGSKTHQSIYDDYKDASNLALTWDSAAATANGDGTFKTTVTFMITKDGLPYQDIKDLPSLEQKRFYSVQYDSSNGTHDGSVSFSTPTPVAGKPGYYTVTADKADYDITATGFNGLFYAYVADDKLDTEGMSLYGNVASLGKAFGTAGSAPYQSAANVSGCEKCHGKPYMKHGYRAAQVAGLGDFAACKTCHYDTRSGGHRDWQLLVDDPTRFAALDKLAKAAAAAGDKTKDSIQENMTAAELAKYAYTANVMNDVHMSHAMEFPYPQSIANCTTCHEGKLTKIQDDSRFVKATCKSCHPWTGDAKYAEANRAPAMEAIWTKAGAAVLSMHQASTAECNTCHVSGGAAATKRLKDLHNGGYNKLVFTSSGKRYSEAFTAKVDTATFASTTNKLTVELSAEEVGGASTVADLDVADITPTLMVGLYGYNTKDFIVAAHGRDSNDNRLLEFAVDGVTTNPRFKVISSAAGKWKIEVDLTMWATMITDKKIKRAEISVLPALTKVVNDADIDVGTCSPSCSHSEHCNASNACVTNDDMIFALNAPSRTFDLGKNAFDDAYYADIVDVKKCNDCHEALGTTFHTADRGGNIRVCRTCHVTLNGGSHLEMQSRSIDSYVHAIHSFQAFDPGDIDFTDPVEKLRYEHHIEHVFPNFTIKNCEACHNPGTYVDPPDNSKSLPGILSGSDKIADRNIGTVKSYVTGPGARACGSCHRTHMINEDEAGKLSAFYQHTKTNGYLVEDDTGVLDKVIERIMSFF